MQDKPVFARGYNLYKLFWIFMIGSFAGDIVYKIYCYQYSKKIYYVFVDALSGEKHMSRIAVEFLCDCSII